MGRTSDIQRGWVAAFATSDQVVSAARTLRGQGYARLEIYSPYSLEGADEALGVERSRLPAWVLMGAFLGAAIGYGIQYYVTVVDYPYDVGGRPVHPVPAFVPATFETFVLIGSLTAFFGFFLLSRLPRLWQPVFETPGFEHASSDLYFLTVDADDPRFAWDRTGEELRALAPERLERLEVSP